MANFRPSIWGLFSKCLPCLIFIFHSSVFAQAQIFQTQKVRKRSQIISNPGYTLPIGTIDLTCSVTTQDHSIPVSQTGTVFPETYKLVVPSPNGLVLPNKKYPLLVVYHGWNQNITQMVNSLTNYKQTAGEEKCWYVLYPTGFHSQHMNGISSLTHHRLALDEVLANNPKIDRNRIYGIGFSMGASAAAIHAARGSGVFAALFLGTGSFSAANEHHNSYCGTQQVYWDALAFAGPPGSATNCDSSVLVPASQEWNYRIMSTLHPLPGVMDDMNAFDVPESVPPLIGTLANVDAKNSLGTNLKHTPIFLTHENNAPYGASFIEQTVTLALALNAIGGNVTYEISPVANHAWAVIDEQQAIGWLGQHSLSVPTSGRLKFVQSEDKHFHFTHEVSFQTYEELSVFDFEVDTLNNTLKVLNTDYVGTLSIDLESAGIDPMTELIIEHKLADGNADIFVLDGYTSYPSEIWRNGQILPAGGIPAATCNTNSGNLTCWESGTGYNVWRFVP